MSCTLIAVDFNSKRVIESECLPKRETWKCDCCNKHFTNVEGANNNVGRIVLTKEVQSRTGKSLGDVSFNVCQKCCKEIGEVNFNEGEV
jgi:hypothetical protein